MPQAPDDPWVSYVRTVVDVAIPGGASIRVRSAPAADPASWPWPDERPVHLLTAWDPGSERPPRAVNLARHVALEFDVRTLSVPHFPAVGVDPVTGRREEGIAVRGLSEVEAKALGARYGQDAVYAWTPSEWAVVACLGGRRWASGWSLVVPELGISLQPGI